MSLHAQPRDGGVAVIQRLGNGEIARLAAMPVVEARALALSILTACNSAATPGFKCSDADVTAFINGAGGIA